MIETEFTATQTTLDGPRGVPTALVYDSVDPYAVALILEPGDQEDVLWSVSRELLHRGLTSHSPIGEGDIKLGVCDEGEYHVELISPDGYAVLHFPTDAVSAFLQETAREVPYGTEADFLNLDAELTDLLGGTG